MGIHSRSELHTALRAPPWAFTHHTSSALTCSPHQRDRHPRAVSAGPTAQPEGRRATHALDARVGRPPPPHYSTNSPTAPKGISSGTSNSSSSAKCTPRCRSSNAVDPISVARRCDACHLTPACYTARAPRHVKTYDPAVERNAHARLISVASFPVFRRNRVEWGRLIH
jgi:hypothetical protein